MFLVATYALRHCGLDPQYHNNERIVGQASNEGFGEICGKKIFVMY